MGAGRQVFAKSDIEVGVKQAMRVHRLDRLIYVIQALSSKFRERRVSRLQFMPAKTADAAFLK
jgi:hypothetical protein